MSDALVKPSLTPVPPLEAPHPTTPPPQRVEPLPAVPRYAPAVAKDICVILAFFSPVGYWKPKRHMADTLHQIAATKADICLAEVSYGKEVPAIGPLAGPYRWIHHRTDSRMFHKENLWNLASQVMQDQYSKFVFIDGDVEFDTPDWLDRTSSALDTFDVVQPFAKCRWLDDERRPYNCRISCAEAIAGRQAIDLRSQHPGFAWAMTRSAWNKIGGWYDRQVLGAGDTTFVLALSQDLPKVAVEPVFESPSQRAWSCRVFNAKLKAGHVTGVELYHKYHGTHDRRQYNQRAKYFPPLTPEGELPLRYDASGLLEWERPEHSAQVLRYFRSREEDS